MRLASPTIIVFAREPLAGYTKTRLIPTIGAANAALLADAFLRDTLAKVRSLGTKLVIAASTSNGVKKSRYFRELAQIYSADLIDQGAGDLGVRMRRALSPYAGNGSSVLLGSDVPSLPVVQLKRSVRLLSEFDLVLGPALDGGYFLIGVRARPPKIFHGIQWGRAQVLRQTITKLHAAGTRYTLAPCWYDVDRAADLVMLSAHLFRRGRVGAHLGVYLPLGRSCPCPATAAILTRLGI